METWLPDARPEISPLHEAIGCHRLDTMTVRKLSTPTDHPDVESRLRETRCTASTSTWFTRRLRRVSAYGLFGNDPENRPRVSSNPCALKSDTSDGGLPAISSPPASTCSRGRPQSESRSATNRTPASSGLYLSVGFEQTGNVVYSRRSRGELRIGVTRWLALPRCRGREGAMMVGNGSAGSHVVTTTVSAVCPRPAFLEDSTDLT